MMIDEDKFFAWLDDELGVAEAAEVEAIVADNLEISALVHQHLALRKRLRAVFDQVALEPVEYAEA
jgi:anti-sigma factor RsiW